MKKYLIIIVLAFISLLGYGQKITFSPEVSKYSSDPNVSSIASIWEEYFTSFYVPDSEPIRTILWDSTSSVDIFRGTVMYYWNQFVINIRKLDDSIYEINTIAYLDSEDGISIYEVYKVCAAPDKEGNFKLMNYFEVAKHKLNHYETNQIDYYYPANIILKGEEAEEAEQFIEKFKRDYKIENKNKIRYILANDLDECSSILGIDYTMMRSEAKYAGRTIQKTILSTRPNHIHELIHGIMQPLFPNTPLILHEGIATYYGGGANNDYSFHKNNFKNNIKTIEGIDFANPDSLHRQIEGETYVLNTLGALIIEYVLNNYGESKVLELFESESYEAIFLKLGVSENDISSFIQEKIIP